MDTVNQALSMLGIQRRVAEKLIDKAVNKKDVLLEECCDSYLTDELKENLAELIQARTVMLK